MGLLPAALLLGLLAGAGAVTVSYDGIYYDVFTVNGTADSVLSNLTTTAWWGNATAAQAVCDLAGNQTGVDPDTGYGTLYVYTIISGSIGGYGFDMYENPPKCSFQIYSTSSQQVYAFSTLLPGPPPDCSLAAFDPPMLSSRRNSQICSSNKAVRQGRVSKYVTNVTLSLLDANNQSTAISITDIVTNKATAGWQCRCRPTSRDNCTCLPNAVLLGGGSFLVMPQWRRSTLPGQVVDTTLQVSFTATALNNSTCSGVATICSAWGVRANRPPPSCVPFDSTGVSRPALTCV